MPKRLLLATAALLASAPAAAEWREASTPHFVIWSESSPAELRKFAERLEGAHQLMARATGVDASQNVMKVRVLMLGNTDLVKRAYGGKNPNVAGFYTVNEAGPLAVSPRKTGTQDSSFGPEVVLTHEYAHHFLLQYQPGVFPSWYVEGFAELMSTVAPLPGGKFAYGKAASHRGYSLTGSRWLPLDRLLTAPYGSLLDEQFDFYGQSWLLTHHLTFSGSRPGQLSRYLTALTNGRSFTDAASAFGDLTALNRDVRRYLEGGSFTYKAVPLNPIDPTAIKLRDLSAGEAGLVMETASMRDNVAEKEAAAWLAGIRAKTSRFPGDRYALQLQAEAEYVAEDYAAAVASADKALSVAPGDARALERKGMAMLRQADDLKGDAANALIKEARKVLVAANAADTEAPLPLIGFYQAQRMQGKINSNGVAGLERALGLVPQDDGVRMMVVQQQVSDGRVAEAVKTLGPLAFSPHASGAQKAALKLYEELRARAAKATPAPAS